MTTATTPTGATTATPAAPPTTNLGDQQAAPRPRQALTEETSDKNSLNGTSVLLFKLYICNACGLVYDEAKGDPDSGLPPGTRFADIPDDWACPLCGVTKTDFSPYTPPDPSQLRATGTGASAVALPRRSAPGVVIVGAGKAGWQLAENLRALDPRLPITLVTACAGHVYDKPLLSVALARQLPLERLVKETGSAAAQRLNLRLLAHTHAVRVCPSTRILRTTAGNLPYTDLVLAHGAQANLPAHLPAHLCWRINHLTAYQGLRTALGARPQRVVIIGAGLIGSELANDLALGGHRVTLLDTQDQPLARWQAQHAGEQVLQAWHQLPIEFVGRVQVASVEATPQGRVVHTQDGRTLACDQVVVATGLHTPSRLAISAGLAWEQGIAVHPTTLATNQPHIHALGDCISLNGQASRYIEPIGRQARTLAAKLAARAHTPAGQALNTPQPYEARPTVVRVKTTSCPLTLH